MYRPSWCVSNQSASVSRSEVVVVVVFRDPKFHMFVGFSLLLWNSGLIQPVLGSDMLCD